MDRKRFIATCSKGCVGLMFSSVLLESCSGTRYISGYLEEDFLKVDEKKFLKSSKSDSKFYKYLIVEHETLQYPIIIYRSEEKSYNALLMQCTHQGAELQAYGDKLQCPAHGSEFNKQGKVTNGPAMTSLKSFQVITESQTLKIKIA